MPIRVAFNATPLLSTQTGIGNYIVGLGNALAQTQAVDAYSFYGYRWRREPPTAPAKGNSPYAPRVLERLKPLLPFRGLLRRVPALLGFRSGLRKFGIDLYHEQNYIPLSYDVPVAITIHDLSWIRYPESQPIDRVRWLERQVPKAIERASLIFVDSSYVREEVSAMFGIESSRIVTAHLGVAEIFIPRTADEVAATLHAHGLSYGQYILTVGTIEPRKNIAHILESFERLPATTRSRFPLVIAGAEGWESTELVARLSRSKQHAIRFLGQVSQECLANLYAGAALFVFPSLYEGFGLPPLESMACGVPVLASSLASMPEVVGDSGEYLDPNDPVDTAHRIAALLADPDRRSEMARRGLDRAASFTWAACAAKTLVGYRRILGSQDTRPA